MNAMMALQRDPFDIEAENYCRRHTPDASPESVAGLAACLRQQAFMREVRPLLDLKVNVYQRTTPIYTVCEDEARFETTWKFCERDQKTLDECDRQIQEIALRYQRSQVRTNGE